MELPIIHLKRPLFVEIAGPAGAGKSTLAKALGECDPNIHIGVYPYTRDVRNVPFFFGNAIPLLPAFISLHRHGLGRKLTRSQQAVMVILRGWPGLLRRTSNSDQRIVILDQGPVYMLSDLLRFGPSNLFQIASSWWDQTCREWGNLLNLVVCLDAPDAVLLDRVRRREKQHGFKQDTDQQAIHFLERCRQTQNTTLDCLQKSSQEGITISFDTSQASLVDVTQSTLALFRQMENRTS